MKHKRKTQSKELKKLWSDYFKNRSVKNRNKLVQHYIPWAIGIASYMRKRLVLPPELGLQDLNQFAFIGLIDSVTKYNPDKKATFHTYSKIRIRGEIIDWIRKIDPVSRLARSRGSTVTTLTFSTMVRNISDQNPYAEQNKEASFEILVDKKSTEPSVQVIKKFVWDELLKPLGKKESKIMKLYYLKGMTMKAIGKLIGISESRISFLHSRAITYLQGLKMVKEWKEDK